MSTQQRVLRLIGDADNARGAVFRIDIDPSPITDGSTVTIETDQAYGQPTRYFEMTPDEARCLAKILTDIATLAEQVAAGELELVED